MRIRIRVHPGSRRPGVGGTHDGALIVRVAERATDGRATAAACAAVAAAFDVPTRAVTLVTGATNRSKILEVEGPHDEALADRLEALLTASDDGSGRH